MSAKRKPTLIFIGCVIDDPVVTDDMAIPTDRDRCTILCGSCGIHQQLTGTHQITAGILRHIHVVPDAMEPRTAIGRNQMKLQNREGIFDTSQLWRKERLCFLTGCNGKLDTREIRQGVGDETGAAIYITQPPPSDLYRLT